jgi:23S rRNA (guanine745-N1)-methyltransferase
MAVHVQTMAFLAETYGGFTSPWKAKLDPRNGEVAYTALVAEHLSPDQTVIEAGCGHGAEALALARQVKELLAFDVAPAFIELAVEAAAKQGVTNVRFLVADCSPKRNGGRSVLPAADQSADLIVSRRGPSSWIGDARRVVRPGGALIQVAYMSTPVAPWNDELPEALRMRAEPEAMPGHVHERLDQAGIPLHSAWTFDVPELFEDPEELYKRLAWDRKRADVPPYEAVRDALTRLFDRHAHGHGLTLRQRRFLWKATV